MCGIVAAIAERSVQSILIEGLKRLEYRGYDSAGVALVHSGQIECTRAKGKVAELEKLVSDSKASQGVAHTRWATHGEFPVSEMRTPNAPEDSRSCTTASLKITRP